MGIITDWIDKTFYAEYARNWDDVLFRKIILADIETGKPKAVLDFGAGAGIVAQMNFKGCAERICGVDPDPRVVKNPFLDEGRVGFGEAIPYGDAEFDLVFSDNVFEHLAQPEVVFSELARVIKPGGILLAKTPNKFHYMPMIARLTPHSFHQWLNKLRGRDSEDTFPTCYLANCPGDIHTLAAKAGFVVEKIELVEGRPEYLRFSAPSYLVGLIYERIVNAIPFLKIFRILLIVKLRKL